LRKESRPRGDDRAMKVRQASLAIDGGGSSARAALDYEGATLVRVLRSGLNAVDLGYPVFEKHIRLLLLPLLRALGDRRVDLRVCAALAGAGELRVRSQCERILRRVIGPRSARNRIRVLSDLEAMMEYYLSEHDGIVLIAGTGSACAGLRRRGARVTRARAGGWGGCLDRGSGFRVGLGVLEAALRTYDGIEEESGMVRLLCKRYGIGLGEVTRKFLPAERDRVAELARIALEAYIRGDPLARSLVREAVRDLTDMVLAVRRKTGLDRRLRLVISGGMFREEVVLRLFRGRLRRVLPQARLQHVTDPVIPILELAKGLAA
jgi:N-acetylglucosamine kinase-like BadF-type ATPase